MTISLYVIIGIGLIVASLLASLMNPFFRSVKRDASEDAMSQNGELPSISIVLVVDGKTSKLQQCLQQILNQDYGQSFEVIAVLEQGDIVSEAILQENNKDNRIYTTFIPIRPMFMSKEKLAVTIGVKASHYDWIVLASSEAVPASEKWLYRMAQHCSNECDMVLGYSNYDNDSPSFWRFDKLRMNQYFMRMALKHTAYRAIEANLMFRKKMFIDGDGYRDNLQYRNGEYDFIVNKYADNGNTEVETTSDADVLIATPIKKTWRNKHLSDKYLNKKMSRSWRFKMLYDMDLFAMYGNYVLQLAVLAYGIVSIDVILIVASCVGLILIVILRTIIAKRIIKQYDAQISTCKIIFYELSIGFRNFMNKLRYLKYDKTEFITHKL